jgi:predicted DNA-binding protein
MGEKKLTITLDEQLAKELETIARKLNKKKYYFDYLDVKVAEERLKRLEKGKTETISAEEAYKRLSL